MTEGRRQDARTARDRLLAEVRGCTDVETGQSLWRAALKFHRRDKLAGVAGPETWGGDALTSAMRGGEHW